jgi:hypothetical protein
VVHELLGPDLEQRAGAACSGGVLVTATAAAVWAAPEPYTNGSSRRDSCHTGTAVLATSAAVYVESGRPATAATGRATRAEPGNHPVQALTAASVVLAPLTLRIQEPTLIGDVTLNIRSMLRKRMGRPRSEIRNRGLTAIPPNAPAHARRASTSLPRRPDR